MSCSRPQSAGPGGRSEAYGNYGGYRGALQQQQLTKLSHNKTSPKWSFGGRRGGITARHGTPGPGSYGDNGWSGRAPSYGFGTSTREGCRPNTAPGPGQYAPQARPKSATPQYRFGTSQRGPSGLSATPGPGSYAPDVTATRQAAPGYTATPRRDSGRRAAVPTPGPGAYQASARADAEKPPAFGFGTGARDHWAYNQTPGPGAYDVAKIDHEGPSYSMRHRSDVGGPISDTPGPGTHSGLSTQFGY